DGPSGFRGRNVELAAIDRHGAGERSIAAGGRRQERANQVVAVIEQESGAGSAAVRNPDPEQLLARSCGDRLVETGLEDPRSIAAAMGSADGGRVFVGGCSARRGRDVRLRRLALFRLAGLKAGGAEKDDIACLIAQQDLGDLDTSRDGGSGERGI